MQTLAENYNNYITIEARHTALNHLFLSVAQILVNTDGVMNEPERDAMMMEFPFFHNKAEFFSDEIINPNYLYFSCRRILKFCRGNIKIISGFMLKLFKVAVADGALNAREIEFLEKTADHLGMPARVLSSMFEVYFSPLSEVRLKKMSRVELKREITKLHPDKFYALSTIDDKLKVSIIHLANNRLKVLNEYYHKKLS
jgi:hypothetical protein